MSSFHSGREYGEGRATLHGKDKARGSENTETAGDTIRREDGARPLSVVVRGPAGLDCVPCCRGWPGLTKPVHHFRPAKD